ncbi:50S ribosomal protein L9 [Candidatus Babeliales bacterium]|nr:50S ribosomal protein L9 [Candidatus Babeliales bacterium]MBP9844058.1 50S ribosomal protein L9 [Candidatus Babeliales bacterium]
MKVFLLQNIEKVGLKNEIIKVSDGYAKNFLFPKKLGVEVTPANEKLYIGKARQVENRAEIIESTSSLLGDQISQLSLKLKKKMHDDDKLYAAISQNEIVDLLKEHKITISKSQVIFDKSIKGKGTFEVTIKLSSKIQPKFKLQVIA